MPDRETKADTKGFSRKTLGIIVGVLIASTLLFAVKYLVVTQLL